MLYKMITTLRRIAIATVPVLALGATAAQADFRGGGTVFALTDACIDAGWSSMPASVTIRYTASELHGAPPSQITVGFFTGTEHFSLWGAMAPSGQTFFGGAGRQTWTRFAFYSTRPLIRIVQRNVTRRNNPSGPNTVQNARELVLRLRIQNFGNVNNCAATITATLRRD